MGNYSRFVRPGTIRVDAVVTNDQALPKPLLVSAFKDGKNFTAVVINKNAREVWINLNSGDAKIELTKSYTTSQATELKAEKINDSKNQVLIAPNYVTTLTGIFK